MTFLDLISNYFTNSDFLPKDITIPGTMFTPLHFIVSAILFAIVIVSAVKLSRVDHNTLRKIFFVIWLVVTVCEAAKLIWETFSGKEPEFWLGGMLPLYPCSIFMYVFPICIFGKGLAKKAACGYVCTLGLLGGLINFVYPATVINDYSVISFPGMQTLIYHGAMVLCAIVMLASGYHSFKGVTHFYELFVPAIPALIMSIPVNIVNFSKIGSDYMFFRLNSFFLAPIGAALPVGACVVIAYLIYLVIHSLPYIPSYISNRIKSKKI